ncbi:MAG: polysaccharide biosynthesis protein [Proteobacteria bacterium]|nr:polysaccharide biosynthesis protein [Pseudomonadota bacterium]
MRKYGNAVLRLLAEVVCLALAFCLAFLVRLDFAFDASWLWRMTLHLPFVVLLEGLALWAVGATRGAWRFVSIVDVRKIALALFIAHIPIVAIRILAGLFTDDSLAWRMAVLPWGIIFINLCLAFLFSVSIRVLRRLIHEHIMRRRGLLDMTRPAERTLLIGAGQHGRRVAESLRLHPELGIEIVGFISDDPSKLHRNIAGLRVLGTLDDLGQIARKMHVTQGIVTQADAHGDALRRILEVCSTAALRTKIVPMIHDIIEGNVDIGQAREISVEDLLHRDPVQLDKAQISEFLKGRRILVSGAGGSIGSEICRQVLAFAPAKIILLERCELFLYELERELQTLATQTTLVPCLADICDASRMEEVFSFHKPEVVFHAAAYKHVPMLEHNPGEAIRNNVEGTMIMANAADAHQCEAFVMVSTDKAVNPTSVMGTSKRIAELYIQSMTANSKTKFCAVRFGNVLGSTGSVLPLFRTQIANGGPLTVTHPDMVRYFMTIPEASQLVMQAATMGQGGEIFVLDMGEPIKIVQLARDLIRLSGKTEAEIPIKFTGTRPGEKLFEELGFDEERMDRTAHPKIYIGKLQTVDHGLVTESIRAIVTLHDSIDNAAVREAMRAIVPEMSLPAGADNAT